MTLTVFLKQYLNVLCKDQWVFCTLQEAGHLGVFYQSILIDLKKTIISEMEPTNNRSCKECFDDEFSV